MRKPDAIILKDNMFVVVEMKGFSGNIKADCAPRAKWRSDSGKVIQPEGSKNPFEQAKFYRTLLLDFLQSHFVNSENAPDWAKRTSQKTSEWIAGHVLSLVVTDEGSKPSITGFIFRPPPYFDVVSLDRLPQKLAFLRADSPLHCPADTTRFIKSVGAKPSNVEWYRGSLTELSSFVGLIPRITNWMESEEYGTIAKALKYIRELELKQHISHVTGCWQNQSYPNLRQEALLILIEWSYEKLGNILDEALQDENPGIADFALDYLSQHGYVETVPTLSKMLQEDSPKVQVAALKAITASGHDSACSIVFDFAKNSLFNKPFKDYQFWGKRRRSYCEQRANNLKDEAFEQLERRRSSHIKVFNAVISSLGGLGCRDSVSWLKQIVSEPASLGFESNDYEELDDSGSGYYGLFKSACESLGQLGIGDKTVTELFIQRLATSPQDFQECIVHELGNLGDSSAVPTLLQFVANREHIFYDAAVASLAKIRSDDSFDTLAKAYLSNPTDDSGRWTGEALAKINRLKLEELLLKKIGDEVDIKQKDFFLGELLPVASVACIDLLFPLLLNPELSGMASWILGNLSDNPKVSNRAMQLTESTNPVEKASAIYILQDYFKQNLDELEKFKTKDAPAEVRRVIANIYYETNSRMKLFEYAHDPDEYIRQCVFLRIAREGTYSGCCFMASDFRESDKCEISIDRESLGIKLPQEVLLVPKRCIKYAQVANNEVETYGVYLEIAQGLQSVQRMLLVPLDRWIGNPKEMSQKMSQQLYSELKVPILTQITEQRQSIIRGLWGKIPPVPSSQD